jgi:hypothetical protein
MGESRFGLTTRHEQVVAANTTVTLDSESLSQFDNIEYSFAIKKLTLARTLKMSVLKSDVNVEDQVYAKAGDQINIELNTLSDGIDYSLEIKNHEPVAVGLVFTKTLL